jgi:hypothetical protein
MPSCMASSLCTRSAWAFMRADNYITLDTKVKATPELARDLVRELRALSQSRFGTTDRWGEL